MPLLVRQDPPRVADSTRNIFLLFPVWTFPIIAHCRGRDNTSRGRRDKAWFESADVTMGDNCVSDTLKLGQSRDKRAIMRIVS